MWEMRDGRYYYYRWQYSRGSGRAHRIYMGNGEAGEQAAAEDDEWRQERLTRKAWQVAEQERWKLTFEIIGTYARHANNCMRYSLATAGFYQHARGEWRRKVKKMKQFSKQSRQDDFQMIADMAKRASNGDAEAIAEMNQVLDANPELWRQCGDLAKQAEVAILKLGGTCEVFSRETIDRKKEELKRGLAEGGSSALENLLIDRIAVCWMAVYTAEKIAAQVDSSLDALIRRDQAFKYLDGAHRRYLQAIKSLAVVRRLAPPCPAPLDIATALGKHPRTSIVRHSSLSQAVCN